jgi:hypothetical protein
MDTAEELLDGIYEFREKSLNEKEKNKGKREHLQYNEIYYEFVKK